MSEQQRSAQQLAASSGIVKDDIYITDGVPLRTIAVSGMLPDTMARDSWRVEDFDLHKELYRGKTSLLYMATDRKSGVQVALKLYRKRKLSTLNRYQVEREIRIHIQLYHHNIIKLYAAFEDEKNVYMVQEFAGGGDLFEDLKRNGGSIKEKYTVRDIVVPFLNALQYLHGMGIIHRDIKPENILLTKERVIKIADFGLSICCSQERPVTRAGTLDYMAPEVLICPDKRRPEENKDKVLLAYTAQVDAWAVGILCYELMVGYPPFEQESRAATYEHIMYKEPKFPNWMSEEAKKFISSALCKNATQRPTISELGKQPLILAYAKPVERQAEAHHNLDFLVERSARSMVASPASSAFSSPSKPVSTASSAACTVNTAQHSLAPVGTKRPGMDASMDSSMDGYHSTPNGKQDGRQNDLKLSVSGKVSNSSSVTLDEDASYSITDFATDDASYYGSPNKGGSPLVRIPSQPRLGASPLIKSRLGASQAGQNLALSISPFQGLTLPQGKVSPVYSTLGAAPKSLSLNGTADQSVEQSNGSYYKPQNGILSDDANMPRSNSASGAAAPAMTRQPSGLSKAGMERPVLDKLMSATEPEYQEPLEKERDSKGVSRLFAKMGWGSSKGSDAKVPDPSSNSSNSSPITGKITSAALALANRSSKGGRTLTEELLSDRSDSLLVTDRHGSVVGAPTMNFKKPNPASLQARAAANQQPERTIQESKAASFRATALADELQGPARMHSEAVMGRVAALANSGRSFTSPNSPTMKKLANAPIVNKIQEYVTQNAGQNMSNA